jgi:sulfur carrier protein
MEVLINHKPFEIAEQASLFQLLEVHQMHEKKGIAVAVNSSVIPKSQWNSLALQPKDTITIIKATQGG